MQKENVIQKKSVFVPEVEGQAKAFASLLARSVREFFRDEQHRKEFEDWYMKKTRQALCVGTRALETLMGFN